MSDYKIKRLPSTFTLTLHGDSDARPLLFSANVQQIGKGKFCTAYRDLAKPEIVYLAVDEEHGDYSKRILLDADDNAHIPTLAHLGDLGDRALFSTCYYHRLKASARVAWKQYRALAEAREIAWQQIAIPAIHNKKYNGAYWQCGHEVMIRTIELLSGGGMDSTILEALEAIADACANYGQTYTFEFAPRNLATDNDGRLILLDPVFDLETIARDQRAAQKRVESRRGF